MPRSPLPRPSRLIAAPMLRAQSDDRLVELVRDGHEPAFAVVVQRYRGQLERYAARIVGAGRAEDAVQQAFVNAHRALVRDARQIELKPWLYRITHNASLNQLRGAHAEPADPCVAQLVGASSAGAEDVAALRARLRETLDAVAALPAPQRDALLLRELEGRSHDEIALALGVSTGAARQHLARARTTVRAAVSAVTPYPLIAKLTALGAGSSAAGSAVEVVAGAGAAATVIKLGAGVAAGGALLGTIALPALRPASPPARDRTAVVREAAGSAEAGRTSAAVGTGARPQGPTVTGRGDIPVAEDPRGRRRTSAAAPTRKATEVAPDPGDDTAAPTAPAPTPATNRPSQESSPGRPVPAPTVAPRPTSSGHGSSGSSGSSASGPSSSADDDDDDVPSSSSGSSDDGGTRPQTDDDSSGSGSSGSGSSGSPDDDSSGSDSGSSGSGSGDEASHSSSSDDDGTDDEAPDEDDIAAD